MTHLNVGVADGKVILGALARGAVRSFGLEVASDALTVKCNAIVAKVRKALDLPGRTELACKH